MPSRCRALQAQPCKRSLRADVVPYTEAAPNKALHLIIYSLRLAALCSGFRQQVRLGVRLLAADLASPRVSCYETPQIHLSGREF
jgi:hypothetical protein